MPDLPTGLFTLEDKVNKLLKNNKNASDVPVPGAVGIMKTGQKWGHVYVVENVDVKNNLKTIAETNLQSGKFSRRTIPLNDKNTVGYWVSPSLKTTQNTKPTIDPKQVSNVVGNTTGLLQGNMGTALNLLTKMLKSNQAQPQASSGGAGWMGGITADNLVFPK